MHLVKDEYDLVTWDWVAQREVQLDTTETPKLARALLDLPWPAAHLRARWVWSTCYTLQRSIERAESRLADAGRQLLLLTGEADPAPDEEQRWANLLSLRSAEGSELWLRTLDRLAKRAEAARAEKIFFEALLDALREEAKADGFDLPSGGEAKPSQDSIREAKAWALRLAGLKP